MSLSKVLLFKFSLLLQSAKCDGMSPIFEIKKSGFMSPFLLLLGLGKVEKASPRTVGSCENGVLIISALPNSILRIKSNMYLNTLWRNKVPSKCILLL